MKPLAADTTPCAEGLNDVKALYRKDLGGVDAVIQSRLETRVALVDQIAHHIINSGGKRLRPLIVLAAARACGYDAGRHVEAAAIIEFIHTATLLHDDVVDSSSQRRGRYTANTVWGNQASVLVGDFLYSRAFQMMVDLGDMQIMRVMADATNTIAEGEVLQLTYRHQPETTEARYLEVIYRKTAKLFEAGAQIAAILAGGTEPLQQTMVRYGRHLGMAYQLVDDALDYNATASEIGKNIGDDLAEGKPTLPLIHALTHGNPGQQDLIREAIEQGGLNRMEGVSAAIESTGALEYTARLAQREADAAITALAGLPESDHKQALIALAEFAVSRRF